MINYYIWSLEHQSWWKPGHCGYTPRIIEAGKYSEAEANKILERANIVDTQEIIIPVKCIHPEGMDICFKTKFPHTRY